MWEKINKLIKNKEFNKAIDCCNKILNENKNDEDHQHVVKAKILLGIAYTHINNFTSSLHVFESITDTLLSEYSKNWSGTELINTYLYFNNTNKALEYNSAFLSHNTGNINGLVTRGQLLYNINELSSSELALKAALKLGAISPQVYFILGLIKIKQLADETAFRFFETAFDKGYDLAIYEIIKLLFKRTGVCDYLNCSNTCCDNLIINGINGKPISNKPDFDTLVVKENKHSCFHKKKELKNGNWLFSCKNRMENNACSDYDNRPELCKDYPSQPLVFRKGCSYKFVLRKNWRFTSPTCFKVVCELLEGYGYTEEVENLKKIHTSD